MRFFNSSSDKVLTSSEVYSGGLAVTGDAVGFNVESDLDDALNVGGVVGIFGLLVGVCVVGLVVGFEVLMGSFIDGIFVGERVCCVEDGPACAFM